MLLGKLLGSTTMSEQAPPRRRSQSIKSASRLPPPQQQPRPDEEPPDPPTTTLLEASGRRSGAILFDAATTTAEAEEVDGRKPSLNLSTRRERAGEVPLPSRRRSGRRRAGEPLSTPAESGGTRVSDLIAFRRSKGIRKRKLRKVPYTVLITVTSQLGCQKN